MMHSIRCVLSCLFDCITIALTSRITDSASVYKCSAFYIALPVFITLLCAMVVRRVPESVKFLLQQCTGFPISLRYLL